jgi:hypothetical protein
MSSVPDLPEPKPGEPVADWAARLIKAVRSFWLTIDPASGLELQHGSGGRTLRRSKRLGLKRAKTGGGGIPAAAGVDTPGKALCTIYDGTTYHAGATDMVYHGSTSGAVAGNTYIYVEPVDGYWHAIWVECP